MTTKVVPAPTHEGSVQVQNITNFFQTNGAYLKQQIDKLIAATGHPAARWLNSGLTTNVLRTNALLRRHEWERIDAAVLDINGQITSGVQDLRSRGCIENLGGLGVLISTYELLGDMSSAEVSMAAHTEGNRDRAEFSYASVPVPIIDKNFQLSIRLIEAARRNGGNLSTMQAGVAGRKVREKVEQLLFNGDSTVVAGSNTLYGYTTYPNRQTISTSADWGTVANIYSSINAMIAKLVQSNFQPPFMLYVNPVQWTEALATGGTDVIATTLDRVRRAYQGILEDIKMSFALAAGSAVMVKLTPDVIDMAIGQDLTTVEWNEQGGMIGNFKVMMCAAPRPKSTADGVTGCGIVHHTGI